MNEKDHRVYYQDLVYTTCNFIDELANIPQGRSRVVCGSASDPTKQVQAGLDALKVEVVDMRAIVGKQWHTMDSAPKDGSEVLIAVESRAGINGRCLVGHWMPGGHCIEDHPPIQEGWYFWNGCAFDKASKPIAWMALPDISEPEATTSTA
jgi:hypothetical protein